MSPVGLDASQTTGTLLRLGVIVPVYCDAAAAVSLAGQLIRSAPVSIPLRIVFVDNGGNGDLMTEMNRHPRDPSVTCLTESLRGPGNARSAAARWLCDMWRNESVALDHCWVISMDADAVVGAYFLSDWETTIRASRSYLIAAGSDLQCLPGDAPAPAEALMAAHWLWDFTRRCEALVGPVNVSGCNHAVRADLCELLGFYIQPTQVAVNGSETLVAGDDWDFGLRARMKGYEIQRAAKPTCLTSSRRLAADPVGFLTGRNYEGVFRPASELAATGWPPKGSWVDIAEPALARLAAHFLIKPLLCGIPLTAEAGWLLGPGLFKGLMSYANVVPNIVEQTALGLRPQWLLFRSQLIERLFQADLVDLSVRLATHLQGIKSR